MMGTALAMRSTALLLGTVLAAVALSGCGSESETGGEAAREPERDAARDRNDMSSAYARSDFRALDANGDSVLDADEVTEWVDGTGAFGRWDANADSELDRDEIVGNSFELWDADGNRTISEPEWKRGTDLWYPDGSDVTGFGDWDADGDSELDADEFKERFDYSVAGESWVANTFDESQFRQAYFELYDTDNDGRVMEGEWVSGAALFGSPRE